MKLPKYKLSHNTWDLIHSLAKSTCERKCNYNSIKSFYSIIASYVNFGSTGVEVKQVNH